MKKLLVVLLAALMLLAIAAQAEDNLVFVPGLESYSYGRFDKSYEFDYGDYDLYGYIWDGAADSAGFEYAEDYLMMLLDRGDFEMIAGYANVNQPGDALWYLYCDTISDYSRFQDDYSAPLCHLKIYHYPHYDSYAVEVAACDGIYLED